MISKKSIKDEIDPKIKSGLSRVGYDIDDLDNLVSLPNDYWGACHLEVQLHRSDHKNAKENDDGHSETYHETVGKLINEKFDRVNFDEYCDGKELQKKMNNISKEILTKIKKFKISLTEKEISDNFRKEDKHRNKVETGCRDIGSSDGIVVFRKAQEKGTLCKMQNRSDKRNLITQKPKEHFPTIKKYTLKTGY